jgi:hypothetical protein
MEVEVIAAFILGLARTSGLNRRGFFTTSIKPFALIGSERTDGCFTARFSTRNMLNFLGGAVAAQRLAVAMQLEKPHLLARTCGRTTARLPVFVCPSRQVNTSWI